MTTGRSSPPSPCCWGYSGFLEVQVLVDIPLEERTHLLHHAVRRKEDQRILLNEIAQLGDAALHDVEYRRIALHVLVSGGDVGHVHHLPVLLGEGRRVDLRLCRF